jgi:hypothetical protein
LNGGKKLETMRRENNGGSTSLAKGREEDGNVKRKFNIIFQNGQGPSGHKNSIISPKKPEIPSVKSKKQNSPKNCHQIRCGKS